MILLIAGWSMIAVGVILGAWIIKQTYYPKRRKR